MISAFSEAAIYLQLLPSNQYKYDSLHICGWSCQIAPCCWSSMRVCIRGKRGTVLHVDQINIMTQNEGGLCVQTAGGPSTHQPVLDVMVKPMQAAFLLHILQLQKDISAPGALSEKIFLWFQEIGPCCQASI